MIPLILFLILLAPAASFANTNTHQMIPPYSEANYDKHFAQFYSQNAALNHQDIASRIIAASNYFMNKPYLLGPLGEGPHGKFDQNPLYRDDAFDCQTYVETVLALAYSKDLTSFKQHLLAIRYDNGVADFKHRNHFTSVDWNKNNSYKGYIRDTTYKFTDSQGQPIAEIAETIIDKPNWYKKFGATQIKQFVAPKTNLLNEIHQIASQVQQEKSVILYLPLTLLFDAQKKPRLEIFKQIQSPSIIEIVRPNWDLRKIIGTHLNVSHMGFAVQTDKGLMYREASSVDHKVTDVPLAKYLRQFLDSKTVKGINVEVPNSSSL